MSKPRLILLVLLIIFIIGLPIFVIVSQNKQETRSHASASTTLSYSPNSTLATPIVKKVGDTVSFDVFLNPGNNQVSYVKLEMDYDPSIINPASTPFIVNSTSFPVTQEGPIVQNGKVWIAVNVGSDPTKAITQTTKVGTINFSALLQTPSNQPASLSFGSGSTVLSVGQSDQASENVLSSSTPAYIQIAPVSTPTPTPIPPTPTSTPVPCDNTLQNGNSTISGFVFNDANSNGVLDANETKLPNWTIHLGYSRTAGIIRTAVTDGNGAYTFSNLCPANYEVSEVSQSGWTQNSPTNPNLYVVSLAQGSTSANNNFGNISTATPTPTPTSVPTPTPTPTPIPLSTTLNLSVLIHGIGSSGDNVNPSSNSLSNKNPLHTGRAVSVQIFDSLNNLVTTQNGTINYDSNTGVFNGSVSTTGGTLTTGAYTVKVQSPTHLRRLVPGIQNITVGQSNTLTTLSLIAGDVNNDNLLNILDYNTIIGCYSDLSPAVSCTPDDKLATDLNDDGQVNQIDYNLFLREITVQTGQ